MKSFFLAAFLIVGMVLGNGVIAQTKIQLKAQKDSIESLLKESKPMNYLQKDILKARMIFIDGELSRIAENEKSTKKLNSDQMPDAYMQNRPKSRGTQRAYFESYEEYLSEISNTPWHKDIVDWDYSNYNLSFKEFEQIEYLNKRIEFSQIKYPLLEAAVFYFTNEERRKAGVPLLKFNVLLEVAAQDHAKDMTTYNFFSHSSPLKGKKSVSDRVERAGFDWSRVGENIAISFAIEYEAGRSVFTPDQNDGYFSYDYRGEKILAHTYMGFAKSLVQQWMDSPGHKQNILDPNFTFLGIGLSHKTKASFYNIDQFYGVQVFGK